MSKYFWEIVSLLAVACSFTSYTICADLDTNDDTLSLILIKSDLVDPFSSLTSWTQHPSASCCSWRFVTCNSVTNRVTHLYLDELHLSGSLHPTAFIKLNRLKVFSLSRNNLTGRIPSHIFSSPTLRTLNLSHNSLYGPIPFHVFSQNSVRFLDLSGNSLSGSLQGAVFSNCSALRFLSLARNFLQGSVPETLYSCTSLNWLDLSRNRFSGNVNFTTGIWKLSRLRRVDLSYNAFSGSVSEGIRDLHYLKEFKLRANRFLGDLPWDIGYCPHLERLDFGENLFSGTIPYSMKRLSSLRSLMLSSNKLSGDFPSWIGSMSMLEELDFSGNCLSGSVSFGRLKSLKFISLSNNKFSGKIPASLAYCTELLVVRFGRNGFDGTIPSGVFELGLEELDFSSNRLIGPIPNGSSKLFRLLRRLDLSRNRLTGSIPAQMGMLSSLRYLNLSWNDLRSRINPEFGRLRNLTVLDLRNVELYGPIPKDFCSSGSLSILQLDGNSLTGPIPNGIGNCSALILLSMSHNNLNGSIPKSISMLKKLRILNVESNSLSGEIPLEFGKLENLLGLNISHNMLIGRLPNTPLFQNLDQSALEGNLGICSPILKAPCDKSVPKPLMVDPNVLDNTGSNARKPEKFRPHGILRIPAAISILAGVIIFTGIVIITLFSISRPRRTTFSDNAWQSTNSSSSISDSATITGKFVLFDSKSSKHEFSPEIYTLEKASEIGCGAFGTLYKASFREGVAIKKLFSSNALRRPEDFIREVQILGKARHENLVPLRGYYWSHETQLLFSDFVRNGSLETSLHERPLSWSNRFNIICGVAKGLAHLHHSSKPPIVHYNVRPSNVLLDEQKNAKLSDFGLARLVTIRSADARCKSALGYAAPELLSCEENLVDEKCDVYGFGMIVLELVTGKRAVEYIEGSVVVLCDYVRDVFENCNISECVDPNLKDYKEEEVIPVLKVGVVCISRMPSCRISMAEVVQILEVIKTPVQGRIQML